VELEELVKQSGPRLVWCLAVIVLCSPAASAQQEDVWSAVPVPAALDSDDDGVSSHGLTQAAQEAPEDQDRRPIRRPSRRRRPACLPPGYHDFEVVVDGAAHSYHVHVPPQQADDLPMILLLHGGGSTAAAMEAVSELRALADEEGFVVVSPEGWPVFPGGPQVWKAGGCCGPDSESAPDHVTVLAAVIDDAIERGACIDQKRVYATGHSNGAMMAYRLACELSDRIAAIAPSASGMVDVDLNQDPPVQVFDCEPSRPVPILHVHGLEDECAPYAGGVSSANGRRFPAIEDVIDRWLELNDCGDGSESWAGVVHRRRWPCARQTAVELITVEGLGHAWAGSPIYGNPERCGGTTTDAVSTTAELWRFFSGYALP
jgi:polyhydroxybutyrate depolymerase